MPESHLGISLAQHQAVETAVRAALLEQGLSPTQSVACLTAIALWQYRNVELPTIRETILRVVCDMWGGEVAKTIITERALVPRSKMS